MKEKTKAFLVKYSGAASFVFCLMAAFIFGMVSGYKKHAEHLVQAIEGGLITECRVQKDNCEFNLDVCHGKLAEVE